MARRLAALLLCLLAVPSSAAADTDYGRIAYVTNRDGNEEIYSTRIDTYFQETNLTNNPAADHSPSYSADGSHIAFVSDRSGRADIWIMNWDGTDPHQVTTGDTGSADADPAWSPDGQRIVFSSSRGGARHLWIANLSDGALTQLTAGDGASPSWSPDGSRIAYSGDGQIRVVDAGGGNDHQLAFCDCTGAAGTPTWSRDGSYLIFARDDDGSSNTRQLYFLPAGGGSGIPITSGPYRYDHPAFSPDGYWLAFEREDAAGTSEELYLEFGPGAPTEYSLVAGPGSNYGPTWGPKYQPPSPPPPPPDTTPPTITINRPTSNTDQTDVYTVGQVVLADYSCTDAESGVRHCDGNVPSGDPIDTRFIGTYEFEVFAADQAGNPIYRRTHYRVIYPFDGFGVPIQSGGLTDLKAGEPVPLKFSLHGAYGLDAVTAATQQPIDCATHAQLAVSATADGTLTYNAVQDRYLFAWTTAKAWAGSCRSITISLRDGTTHRADIRFTK